MYEEIQYNNKGFISTYIQYSTGRKEDYVFDAYGNAYIRYVYSLGSDGVTWTKIGTHTFFFDTTTKDLQTGSNAFSYEYDEMGNLIKSYNNAVLTWNGKWLESFYSPSLKVRDTYSYNSYGYRVAKTVAWDNGTVEYHTYTLEGSKIIAEKIVIGETTTNLTYWYDQNGEVAGLVYNGTAVYTFVKNQYGDVIAIIDENGTKVVNYIYDPYGRILKLTDTSGINIGTLNPFRYRSYYYDDELDVYYLQSRYYYPYNMKFLSPDSPEYLTDESTLVPISVYAYCGNEPIEYVDPEGQRWYYTLETYYRVNWIDERAVSFYHSVLRNYDNNKNVCKKYRFSYINNQNTKFMEALRYGSYKLSYMGCGIIATYNLLLYLGRKQQLYNIIKEFELNNLSLLKIGGGLGISPFAIKKYFVNHKLDPKRYYSYKKYKKNSKKARAGILMYFCEGSIFKGAHYIMFYYDKIRDRYRIYNGNRNYAKTLDDVTEGGFYIGYLFE